MANIIHNTVAVETTNGPEVYYVFTSDSGLFYNGSGFEVYNSAHWTSYVISMPNIGSNIFQGTFPNVAAGVYYIYAYAYSTTPNSGDDLVGYGITNWNGNTETGSVVDNTVIELDFGSANIISSITFGADSNTGGDIQTGIQ